MLLASISNDLFTMGVPIAEKAIRTVAVYFGILLLLRLAGKRDLAFGTVAVRQGSPCRPRGRRRPVVGGAAPAGAAC